MLPQRVVRLHRNDHGHRFHTCHHERCHRDHIERRAPHTLSTGARQAVERPDAQITRCLATVA